MKHFIIGLLTAIYSLTLVLFVSHFATEHPKRFSIDNREGVGFILYRDGEYIETISGAEFCQRIESNRRKNR